MPIFPARSESKFSIFALWAVALFLGGATPIFSASPSKPWTDPRVQAGELVWFSLDETRQQLIERLGQPPQTGQLGSNFLLLQYQIDTVDNHDFSHIICIRKADGKIVSIARNYEEERNVDELFPPGLSEVHTFEPKKPTSPGQVKYGVRVRKLSNGRLLLAMGSDAPGKKTSQLLLIRESELGAFMPWLEESLQRKPETNTK